MNPDPTPAHESDEPVARTQGAWIGLRVVHALLEGAYCIAILIGTPARAVGPGNIISGTDSVLYTWAAHHWPWEPTAARVAPLMPTLYAALGVQPRLLVVAQTIIAVLAWQWLARWTARWCQHEWVGLAAGTAVLMLSLAPEIILWNAAVASESLAVSCVALVVAATVRAAKLRTGRAWVVAGAWAAVSVLARDTFVVIALPVVVVAIVVASRRRDARRPALLVAAMCIATVLTSQVLANQGDPPRWYYPFQENIVLRVLADEEMTHYFLTHALPQVDDLRAVARGYYLQFPKLSEDPKFAPFRTWMHDHGQSVYLRAVVRHPGWVFSGFWRDRRNWTAPVISGYSYVAQARPGAVYGVIGSIVYWREPPELVVALAALAMVLLCIRRMWGPQDRTLRWLLAGLWVSGVLHIFGAYLGDALEVGRHTVTGTTQVRIVMVVTFVLFCDRVASRLLVRTRNRAETGAR